MKPFRRKTNLEVTQDPVTGQDRILNQTEEEHSHSNQGSVDSMGIQRKFFLDCGCDSGTGGRCFECGAISCTTCHGHCHNCHKPICLQHSHFLSIDDQEKVRFCSSCYGALTRKRRMETIGHFFLSFIMKTEERSDDR